MSLPDVVRPIQRHRDGGRLWPTLFRSDVLSARCNVFVYTPPRVGASGAKLADLPVLYLLHGKWGSEIDWPFKGDAQGILDREIRAGRVPPMLVAMPHDGLADDGTFYVNWHDRSKGSRFEDYVLSDLRRFVEVELAGRMRTRRRRLIAGLSMGGFGALALSLRHPELFVAAASLSGAVRPAGLRRTGGIESRIFGPAGRGRDPADLLRHAPAARKVALYLDCGRADELLAMNRAFHARLDRLGIEHTYVEYGGAHDWPSWRKRLPHVLRFLARQLPEAPR